MTTANHKSYHSHQPKRAAHLRALANRAHRIPAAGTRCRRSQRSTSPAEFRRDDDLEGLPEVSEVDVIRHFVRMSTWNYSIDLGMYPLGSCTMKYNSRLNERVARIAGFANLHPLTEEHDAQGALQVIYELQQHLAEITGFREFLCNPPPARTAR